MCYFKDRSLSNVAPTPSGATWGDKGDIGATSNSRNAESFRFELSPRGDITITNPVIAPPLQGTL